MSFALVYLIQRFFYRLGEFLRHWYIVSFFDISHAAINFLERLDQLFALRVTFRNWLKPLYQDYTTLGYILGFFFRTGRVIAGGLVYAAVIVIAAGIYLAWAAVPIYIIINN